jgi:hypothetical protein
MTRRGSCLTSLPVVSVPGGSAHCAGPPIRQGVRRTDRLDEIFPAAPEALPRLSPKIACQAWRFSKTPIAVCAASIEERTRLSKPVVIPVSTVKAGP